MTTDQDSMSSTPHRLAQEPQKAWWKEACVYQIYPSSFKDSNADGIGDIPGVIEKLDYIEHLGVDVVWICPIYESPRVDMGYDISDYRAIDPVYGTMENVEALIEGLHKRKMKFLMDLVINHTSDQHVWFQESRSSLCNKRRDWYIWRQPRFINGERHPPNNWSAYFGGSAWSYDETSGEYYLHLFAPEQPDLNWDCDEMRREVYEMIRFWLDKGVDGFRMDVINLISKDPKLPDARVVRDAEYHHGCEHYANGPRLHEFLREISGILKEYNAFSVGEMPWISDEEEILRCVKTDRRELNMIFNFDIVEGIDHGVDGKFSPRDWQMKEMKQIVNKWQQVMHQNDGWNALFLENHDQARTVSRWARDSVEHCTYAAKMFATFLGLQSGTLFLYQGQELGMSNIPKDWEMHEFRDLETLNHWRDLLNQGASEEDLKIAKTQYHLKSRDNARTPMQWSAEQYAGFSSVAPWFRVNDSYTACNASHQVGQQGSTFEHWRSVLALRKALPDVLVYGSFQLLDAVNDDIFAYARQSRSGLTVMVVCNFRDSGVTWEAPVDWSDGRLLLSSHGDLLGDSECLHLRPFESFACLLHTVPLKEIGGCRRRNLNCSM